MSDPTNDIDALLGYLSGAADRYSCHTIPSDVAADYHAALTALVAERDALSSAVVGLRSAMKAQDDRERDAGERCGVSRDLSGCDWPDAVADEVIALEARVEQLEMYQRVGRGSASDRDRELRERLVCAIWPELLRIYEKTDTPGAKWDLVRINARAQALLEADAMIAAMRKGESDGK